MAELTAERDKMAETYYDVLQGKCGAEKALKEVRAFRGLLSGGRSLFLQRVSRSDLPNVGREGGGVWRFQSNWSCDHSLECYTTYMTSFGQH